MDDNFHCVIIIHVSLLDRDQLLRIFEKLRSLYRERSVSPMAFNKSFVLSS